MRILTVISIILFLSSCYSSEQEPTEQAGTITIKEFIVSENDPEVSRVDGVVFYKGQVFDGFLVDSSGKSLIAKQGYADGLREGEGKKYFEDGSVMEQRSYHLGKKQGIHKVYWANGNLKMRMPFNEEGTFEGKVEKWYESGAPYMMQNYLNGQEEGMQRLWEEDGKLVSNYYVRNGRRFGKIGIKKCYEVK